MVICDLKQRKSQDGQVTTSSLVMCWPFKTKGKFKKMNIEKRMLPKISYRCNTHWQIGFALMTR